MLINKNKKAILSLILSLIIPLSACTSKSNDRGSDTPVAIESSIDEDLKFDKSYAEKKDRLFALSFFRDYLDSIYVEYPLIDHYLSDEEIDNLISSANTRTRCLKTYSKDVGAIIDKIKANSEEFLKNNPKYMSAFSTDHVIYGENEVFERALWQYLPIMMNETNNLNEDIHRLEDLVIVFGEGSGIYDEDDGTLNDTILGYYDPRINLMVIDPFNIRILAEYKETESDRDKFYDLMLSTLMHEFNHVRQNPCACRIEQNETILSSIKYDTLYSSSLTESSAESELYNLDTYPYNEYKTSSDYSYSNERNEEAIIFLMALFNENALIDDYYDAVFDTDYSTLYNFLSLTHRDDIRRFYNVLYTMDAICLRNDLVLNVYSEEEREIKTLSDFRTDLGYGFLIDLYRFVLNRMSTYTYNHPDLSLEDNLVLLSTIQDILCDPYFTAGDKDSLSYQTLRDNLTNMDYAYKTFLCDFYSVEMEDIQKQADKILTYELCLDDMANNKDTSFRSYSKKSEALLQRFPILKAILMNRNLMHINYENVLADNKLKITLD